MHRHLPVLSLTLCALLLGGCGGGGSGGGTPVADAGSTLTLATVPYLSNYPVSSPYPDGSAERGGWIVLQQARIACGFGQLTHDSRLDAAAKLHAQYQTYIASNGNNGYLSHYEDNQLASDITQHCDPTSQICNPYTGNGNPYYREYNNSHNPWDRTTYQNYGNQVAEILEATTWDYDTRNLPSIPTLEQRGASSMRDLLNTVYHLIGAMYKGSDIGFGADLQTRSSGTSVHEEYRFGALNGYQTSTLAINYLSDPVTPGLATYPCAESSTVPSSFAPALESPNPFEGTMLANQKVGPPIYLKVDAGQTLTLTSASITGPDTASVPYTPMTHQLNDPASELLPNEYFLVPNTPLQANSNYAVTLKGSISQTNRLGVVISSKNFTRSFTLKTGA